LASLHLVSGAGGLRELERRLEDFSHFLHRSDFAVFFSRSNSAKAEPPLSLFAEASTSILVSKKDMRGKRRQNGVSQLLKKPRHPHELLNLIFFPEPRVQFIRD
jgi:hypothetical protein